MSDAVRPNHYGSAIQAIDAIEDWQLGFNLGNVVKYVSRAGKKDPNKRYEDLAKARWYLEREMSLMEEGSLGRIGEEVYRMGSGGGSGDTGSATARVATQGGLSGITGSNREDERSS